MLKVGFGKRSISPPIGAPLAGFAARQGVCKGIHDELFARALVIENGAAAVALLSLDLLALASDFVAATRRAIAARVPIEPSAILIASTHTHAGPVTISTFFNPDELLDTDYMARLSDAMVEAVEAAWRSRFPARLGIGTGTIDGLGVNRRSPDGRPIDREIGIWKADDANGRTRAVLLNYACHPTVLGPDNLLASGDFPAATIERMEDQLGEGSFAMYVNGAQGDISVGHSSELSAIGVITSGRTFARAAELGHKLGDAVLSALPTIPTREEAPLRFGILIERFVLKPYPAPEQTEKALRESEARVNGFPAGDTSAEYRRAKSELLYSSISHFYARQAIRYKDGLLPMELQAIQIGDSVFIAVPAEVFVEIGMRIKNGGGPRTFIAGVTNGYIGYLPTRKAFETGGYEVVSARCDPDAEDRLVDSARRLKETLGSLNA